MQTSLIERALDMALGGRCLTQNFLHHSDQGSMSGVGDCYDNAVMESIFRTLKTECANRRFATRAEARRVFLRAHRISIGIHSGELVVGAIGAPHCLDCTVIGDTVNVAARIEALTRQYNVNILLSDTTRSMLPEEFVAREMGTTEVRNRVQPITLWALLHGEVQLAPGLLDLHAGG